MTGTEFAYALIAGIVPSLIWLFFWTREDDKQPEPRSLLAACFLGGMISVLAAIPAERYAALFAATQSQQYILWAVIEECFKFIVVIAVALHTKWNDEPIDAMVYCIAVALGFAALENTLFIMGAISDDGLLSSIVTDNLRFFGATMVHVMSSSLIGFALGWTFYKGKVSKTAAVVVALVIAAAAHAAFNISIAGATPDETLRMILAWAWAEVVLLIILFEEVKAVRPAGSPVAHTSPLA